MIPEMTITHMQRGETLNPSSGDYIDYVHPPSRVLVWDKNCSVYDRNPSLHSVSKVLKHVASFFSCDHAFRKFHRPAWQSKSLDSPGFKQASSPSTSQIPIMMIQTASTIIAMNIQRITINSNSTNIYSLLNMLGVRAVIMCNYVEAHGLSNYL